MNNNSTENRFHFFLDESGDHGLSFVDPNFPLFLLVGCLFENTELQRIGEEINNFKKEFFNTTEVILHSRDIRKCEGAFQIIKNKLYCDRNGKYDGYGLKVFP